VERDFQTLQDRLINELRLHNVTTISEANHYLKEEFIPKWNKRFAREPQDKVLAYRSIPVHLTLSDVLCIKGKRRVYPDNTISYNGTKYQILPDPYRASYAKAEVDIFEHLDGKISIVYKQRKLKYRKIATFKEQREISLKDDISILQKR